MMNVLVKSCLSGGAMKIVKTVCENPEIFIKMAEVAKEGGEMAFDAISESKRNRHEVDMKAMEIYDELLTDPNLDTKERMDILMNMQEHIDKVNEKDTEDKEREFHTLQFIAGTLFGGPVYIGAYYAVKHYQNQNQNNG